MTKRMLGWARLPLAMIAWAGVAVTAADVGPALAIVVGLLLVALLLWLLRATAQPDQTWGSTFTVAIVWAAWSLAAWLGLLFAVWMAYFAGASLGWWEIHDR